MTLGDNSDEHEDSDVGVQDGAMVMSQTGNEELLTKDDGWSIHVNRAQAMEEGSPLVGHPQLFRQIKDETLADLGRFKAPSSKERGMVDKIILFLARLFGAEGKTQVEQFMSTVRDIPFPVTGDQQASRNRPVVVKPGAPLALRRIIEAYHRQTGTRTAALVNRCMRYVHLSDFYRQYDLMVSEACVEGSETRDLFRGLGYKTSRGRDWRSVVSDYLVHILEEVDFETVTKGGCKKGKTRMRNELALSHPYYVMESALGRGVFVLLPEQDINR